MKNLQYDPEDQYEIDWDKGDRKYQTVTQGVRVYEHGEVMISRSGDRDPDWRKMMLRMYDLDFRLLSEMPPAKFYTPEDRPIAKNQIADGCYLYERGRIYNITWRDGVSIYSPDAQPSPEAMLPCAVRRVDKEKARLIELKEHFALGHTTNAVAGTKSFRLEQRSRKILAGDVPLPHDLTDELTRIFCQNIAGCEEAALHCIEEACKDKLEVLFLTVKEK